MDDEEINSLAERLSKLSPEDFVKITCFLDFLIDQDSQASFSDFQREVD